MRPHPVFDRTQWPSLWKRAMKNKRPHDWEIEAFMEPIKCSRPETDDSDEEETPVFVSGDVGYFVSTADSSVEWAVSANDPKGAQLGLAEFQEGPDGRLWLDNIHVREEFQNNGIGKNLIAIAVEHIDEFFIACAQQNKFYQYSLTSAGEKLISRCLAEGIVSENQLIFPPHVPLEESATFDPGMPAGVGLLGEAYARWCGQGEPPPPGLNY